MATIIDALLRVRNALGLVEFLFIITLLILIVVLYYICRHVFNEIKTLKKDVNACHTEKRNLKDRCDQQEVRIKEGIKRENLLSALVSEMRELIVNIKDNRLDE